jgi:hypothetical protein
MRKFPTKAGLPAIECAPILKAIELSETEFGEANARRNAHFCQSTNEPRVAASPFAMLRVRERDCRFDRLAMRHNGRVRVV